MILHISRQDVISRLAAAMTVLGIATLASSCMSKDGAASVATAQEEAKGTAVSTVRPQRKSAQGELLFTGTLHARDEVDVVAETQGKVIQLFIDTGSRVSRGDILAQIDDELKQSAFKTAQISFDKSKSDWDRAQGLYEQKVISDSERQGVRLAFANTESQFLSARRDFENAKVRAPLSGVVTQRYVSVGSMIGGGTPVAHIVDSDDLKLIILVGEKNVLKIRIGQLVDIESDLYTGSTFRGAVSAVSPKGDSTLSFPIEIALKADQKRPLFDGMSAKARIGVEPRTILAIPRTCIVGSFQSPQVYVVQGGIASLKSISIGAEYGTDIEVLSGLTEGDVVVSGGVNNLRDGATVEIEGGSAK